MLRRQAPQTLLCTVAFLVVQQLSAAAPIVSNLDETTDPNGGMGLPLRWAAQFTTDSHAYEFDSVIFRVRQLQSFTLTAAVHSDAGGLPGSMIGSLNVPLIGSAYQDLDFTAIGNIALAADTSYWVVLYTVDFGPTSYSWATTASSASTGPGTMRHGSAASWTPLAGWHERDLVGATPLFAVTPEPSALSLLVLGALQMLRRNHRR